ncbi:TPA: hypothetical protein ACH3X1_014258 [Trebouxia sp. C0004]
MMGWIHSARKSQLASKTTTALAMIKMYYNSLRDRDSAPKPIREVDMIMQKEQLVAGFAKRKVTTKAIVAAVEASTQIDLTDTSTSTAIEQPDTEDSTEQLQDMSAFSPAEEVELASTDEVPDLF